MNGTKHSFTSYATFECYQKSTVCAPLMYANTTDALGNVIGGGWITNPKTQYTDEMLPRYQTQTTFLKNGLNNGEQRVCVCVCVCARFHFSCRLYML